MGLQLVFADNLDASKVNLSTRFTGATAFIIEAPLLSTELEIDCYLQIYVQGILGEIVRNVPLGRIEEQSVLLNLADTEICSIIPAELLETGLEMALLFVPSIAETAFIYATVIKPDCSLCALDARLDVIESKIDLIDAKLRILIPVVPASMDSGDFNHFFLLSFF